METEAEKAQETEGELDDQFVVLAENEEEAIMQFTSSRRVLVYTARKSRSGRWFKGTIPIAAFVDLAREVLKKVDAGEIEVEVAE